MKKGLLNQNTNSSLGGRNNVEFEKSKSAKKLMQKKKSIEGSKQSFDITVITPGKQTKMSHATHA